MKRAYTIERNELVCDLYAKGKTITELCETFHLTECSIRGILKEGNVLLPQKKLSPRGELITQMLLDGSIPRQEITNIVGVKKGCVAYYVRKLGLEKDYNVVTHHEVELMRQMRHEHGLNNADIARRLGRNVVTITKHIGKQPNEVTSIFRQAGQEKRHIDHRARVKARKYYEAAALEAARLEAERLERERIERERIEALRLAKENEIKELLAELGIPCENFTIDSAENGDAFLNNLITRAAEKLSVGA